MSRDPSSLAITPAWPPTCEVSGRVRIDGDGEGLGDGLESMAVVVVVVAVRDKVGRSDLAAPSLGFGTHARYFSQAGRALDPIDSTVISMSGESFCVCLASRTSTPAARSPRTCRGRKLKKFAYKSHKRKVTSWQTLS